MTYYTNQASGESTYDRPHSRSRTPQRGSPKRRPELPSDGRSALYMASPSYKSMTPMELTTAGVEANSVISGVKREASSRTSMSPVREFSCESVSPVREFSGDASHMVSKKEATRADREDDSDNLDPYAQNEVPSETELSESAYARHRRGIDAYYAHQAEIEIADGLEKTTTAESTTKKANLVPKISKRGNITNTTVFDTECKACGNTLMQDSNYCRKCGVQRGATSSPGAEAGVSIAFTVKAEAEKPLWQRLLHSLTTLDTLTAETTKLTKVVASPDPKEVITGLDHIIKQQGHLVPKEAASPIRRLEKKDSARGTHHDPAIVGTSVPRLSLEKL